MIIEIDWVREHYRDPNVRLVDCRFHLQDKGLGYSQYSEYHIPGAVYFDLEKDLSGSAGKHGGRHPLPSMAEFIRKLEKAGISNDTTVIAYDSGTDAFAARFCWMLEYAGHKNVFLLNGGISQWKKAGLPLESDITVYPSVTYIPSRRENVLATYSEVKEQATNPKNGKTLIDSREYARYAGRIEPLDKRPGHIPGAINAPWTEGVEDGLFLDADQQKLRFGHLDPDKEFIVYCGSGVTAVPNYIALKQAGFHNVKVYIGSYSDWVSYDENPVETES